MTTTAPTLQEGVHYRDQVAFAELAIREDADTGKREVVGIAVPYDTDAHIRDWFGEYIERFERGAVQDSDDALLYWRHSEPIGKITAARNTDAGWEITASISQTLRGDEAYALLKDEVIREFSIGFEPINHREEVEDGTEVVVRTKVKVREVSLVPFGAFGKDAPVSQVRDNNTNQVAHARATTNKENTMTETQVENDGVTAEDVRADLQDMERRFMDRLNTLPTAPAPEDTRSAGEILKAIVAGDETVIREYEQLKRAYEGGTTADAVMKPSWVGDLTRIFDASTGVLSDVFSTGTLPSTGESIEFAELDTNTIAVNEQAAEGDDITFGKVKITTRTAPVKTYAGGTQLTRQSIERASVGVLNTSLQALAMAAGARKKASLRTAYNTLVTAREGIASNGGVVLLGATLAASDAGNWENALIDAAVKYETNALGIDTLVVSGSVFKKLRSLTVSGERVFQTHKDNASGTLNLPGLSGNFAGIPVRLDSGQAGDKAVFANARALRQYDSALVSLSDENIVNLSKSFAVYRYGAVAAEIPAAIVPVKLAAS